MVAVGFLVAALWAVLCRHLSNEWSINEQYSYGWFVPFFAIFLFWLRWEDRPQTLALNHERAANRFWLLMAFAASALLLLLPLRLFEVANPDWRPLGWIHAGLVVTLTLLVLWTIGGGTWLRHFGFPVCFIFIAVPWISAVEMPVVQGLMRAVAAVAAETLNLLGVPAQLEGNLIRVNTGLVGVNEACSGVRSLQTSLMIGLLFGELKRLTVPRRLLLLSGAVAIALIANCGRALLLVSLAAKGTTQAVGRWHDVAGYSIVGLVFIGTLALAALLAKHSHSPATGPSPRAESLPPAPAQFISKPPRVRLPTAGFLVCFASLIAVELCVEGWYRAHERDLVPEKGWTVKWPKSSPAFRQIEIDEGVKRTLRFDEGDQSSWRLPSGISTFGANSASCVAYFFRWNAGGTSVVRARAHRPDICLPDAGWDQLEDRGVAEYPVGDLVLPFRRVSFRKGKGDMIAHTYFCLQEDQRRPTEERPDLEIKGGRQPDWSIAGRSRIVRNGVRNLGQQVLEIAVLTNNSIAGEDVDRQFAALLKDLIVPINRGPHH